MSSGASFASWGSNPLRKRLRLLRTFAWALFFVVLAAAVLGLTQSISRSLIPFVQVPAVITAEARESRGPQCLAELAYTFNGRAETGSYTVNTSCLVLPGAGATVKIKVNPENPQDVVIVGHEASDRDLPLPIGLGAGAAVIAAGFFVVGREKSWRRARSVGSKGLPWLQVTGTVRRHVDGWFHEVLVFEAEDADGQSVVFQIRLPLWSGMPKPWAEAHLLCAVRRR